MKTAELQTSKALVTGEIIEYLSHSIVVKTILTKNTGNIRVMSFDKGEGQAEKTCPFDTYAQIIEGNAEMVIDNATILLETGQSIIIPANKSNRILPNGRFKMILTVFKNGYE
jgi:quercetin dioxygenase-like cupin family protein